MKRKKPKEITDEMIGMRQDLRLSAIVGDIINATNAAEKKSFFKGAFA